MCLLVSAQELTLISFCISHKGNAGIKVRMKLLVPVKVLITRRLSANLHCELEFFFCALHFVYIFSAVLIRSVEKR